MNKEFLKYLWELFGWVLLVFMFTIVSLEWFIYKEQPSNYTVLIILINLILLVGSRK